MRLRAVMLDSITDEGFADKSANVDGMASLIAFWTPGSTTETVEIEEADYLAVLQIYLEP